MAKPKKGQKLVCVPCGREVLVNACGMSDEVIWCCGRPMVGKSKKHKK